MMAINVKYHEGPGTAGQEGDIFNHRRPLFFDGQTLYVGGLGQYHQEAMEAHGLNIINKVTEGVWFPHGYESPDRPHVKKEPGRITWFSDQIKPEFQVEIAQHLNAADDTHADDGWTFASEARSGPSKGIRGATLGDPIPEPRQGLRTAQNGSEHQLGWQPGSEGKGYVTNDGVVHTWNTEGGAPHHPDYLFGLEPHQFDLGDYEQSRELTHPFTIGPDGLFSWSWDQAEGKPAPPVHPSDVDPRLTPLFEEDEPGEWHFGSSEREFNLQEAQSIMDRLGYSFSPREFAIGLREELEHRDVTGGDIDATAQIAAAHLNEDPEYYSKLVSVGLAKPLHFNNEPERGGPVPEKNPVQFSNDTALLANREFSLLNHLVNNPYEENGTADYHTWTPGNRGKGMILPDGRPATWNIEHAPNAPTYGGHNHAQVAEYLGLERYPQVSDAAAEEDRLIDEENGFEHEPAEPGWHTPIYINPDGSYGTLNQTWNKDRWHTDNTHPAFDQLGLTRESEDNGWTFG